jgi:hypothetical protein
VRTEFTSAFVRTADALFTAERRAVAIPDVPRWMRTGVSGPRQRRAWGYVMQTGQPCGNATVGEAGEVALTGLGGMPPIRKCQKLRYDGPYSWVA